MTHGPHLGYILHDIMKLNLSLLNILYISVFAVPLLILTLPLCLLLYTGYTQVPGEWLKCIENAHRLIYPTEGWKELSVVATIWRWLFSWALFNNLNIPTGPLRERRWICECLGRDSCILHFILNLGVSDLINKEMEMNRRKNTKISADGGSF